MIQSAAFVAPVTQLGVLQAHLGCCVNHFFIPPHGWIANHPENTQKAGNNSAHLSSESPWQGRHECWGQRIQRSTLSPWLDPEWPLENKQMDAICLWNRASFPPLLLARSAWCVCARAFSSLLVLLLPSRLQNYDISISSLSNFLFPKCQKAERNIGGKSEWVQMNGYEWQQVTLWWHLLRVQHDSKFFTCINSGNPHHNLCSRYYYYYYYYKNRVKIDFPKSSSKIQKQEEWVKQCSSYFWIALKCDFSSSN